MLSGLTVEEVKAGRSHGVAGAQGARAEGGAARARVDPATTPAHARRAAPTKRSRATAGCSSSSSMATACSRASRAARRCCSRATATTTPRSFRKSRGPSRRCPSTTCIIDGEVVVLDTDGQAELLAAAAARAHLVAARHQARGGRAPGGVLRVRPARVRGLRRPRPCRSSRRKQLLAELIPKLGAVRYLDHIEREGEAFLKQVAAIGLEGIIAKKADAPVSRRTHAAMAQDQGRAHRRLRDRRLHGAKGQPHAASARCSSPTTSTARSSTRGEPARGSTTGSSTELRDDARRDRAP